MGAMSNSSILRPSVRRRYLLRKEREEQRERERRREQGGAGADVEYESERRRPTSLRERSESLERLRQVLGAMSTVAVTGGQGGIRPLKLMLGLSHCL